MLGVLGGECETPVGLRTKSIAVGTPAVARIPASCPAPVARTGASPSRAASRAASAGSKGVCPVQDSSTGRTPVRSATSSTTARTPGSAGPRASSHAVTWDGIALTPLGSTRTLPTVATQP